MTQAKITTSIVVPSSEITDQDLETLAKRGEEIQKLNESNKFKIAIEVIGIKKRCRKSERHMFQLGYVPYNNGSYCPDILKEQIKGFLDSNMKEVSSAVRVHLDHVIITQEGYFTSTKWEPFSDKNKRFDFNY